MAEHRRGDQRAATRLLISAVATGLDFGGLTA